MVLELRMSTLASSRQLSVSLPVSVLLVASLVACKQDDPEKGTFAEATTAQRQAAVVTAAGLLPPLLVTSLLPASMDAFETEGTCPVTSESGEAVVFTGEGCVGPSGITWGGELRTVNVPNFWDLGSEDTGHLPMSVEADGWALDDLVFDGEFWQSALVPEDEWIGRGDLTVVIPGLATVSWEGELACESTEDGGSVCTAAVPPVGTVDGLAPFTIEGSLGYSAEGQPTGQLLLVAEDELFLDLDAMDAETGCVPATIDGEEIEPICLGDLELIGGGWEPGEPGEPGEPSDIVFNGSGIGFDGEQVMLDAFTEGGAAAVHAFVRVEGDDAEELHPLALVDETDTGGASWYTTLVDGAYQPGSQSALQLVASGADGAAVMFQALDAEGEVAACTFVGFTSGDPAELFDATDCPADTW